MGTKGAVVTRPHRPDDDAKEHQKRRKAVDFGDAQKNTVLHANRCLDQSNTRRDHSIPDRHYLFGWKNSQIRQKAIIPTAMVSKS
jgi:hypothetical protein